MEEQEIDLRDYINVLIKRKWIVISIFLLSVIITTVLSFNIPKIYKSTAVISYGFIDGEVLNKSEGIEIITSRDILESVIEKLGVKKTVEKFKEFIDVNDISNTLLVKITAKADTPQNATRICEEISNEFINYGNRFYNKRKAYFAESINTINEQMSVLEKDISNLESIVASLLLPGTDISPEIMSKTILLRNLISDNRGKLIALSDRKDSITATLVKAEEFRIIDSPLEPEFPVFPKKKLMVAVSGILSLMFGTFLAFFMEFWQKNFSK